ncbi:MAG: hypothetical protein C0490_02005 [Marivirga sp.]|nr:hypothetical protein [Marivirga sp.]
MAQTAQLFNEQHQDILFPNRENNNKSVSNNVAAIFNSDSFYHQPTAFYYNDRARLQFNLTDVFSTHFVLVKGLIEFSRPSTLKFKFTPDQKAIETDVPVNQFEELANLFLIVYKELHKEIRFKAALKRAIQFEQRYNQERTEVYSGVF